MRRAAACGAGAIHVALSSIELSILGAVAFDPDTLPAIRSGTWINTIDADDSGTLRHTIPLDGWPEALWRVLFPILLAAGTPTQSVDLATLYAPRLVPDPADRTLLVSLTPFELGQGLRATYPDALARMDRVAARILYLEELEWSHDPIALIPGDALSDAGWAAVGSVLPDPDDRWRWSLPLRIASRSTWDDDAGRRRRATLRVKELHAVLHLACELSCNGYDVDGYHRDLSQAVLADPVALDLVRDRANDPADELAIVRLILDQEQPGW
ncbi:hypothetical protein [Sphingomonas sp. 1185]|uniref:hypothetical protein n=1 Tax=Sphingomonas sp. 1185 TaxID=3156411 RepID=UPI003396CF40